MVSLLEIPAGILVANAGEWLIHKYVLHGLGRNRKSFWSYHWHDHHRSARLNGGYDEAYKTSVFRWSPQGKEALGLALITLTELPLFTIAPLFASMLVGNTLYYYYVHKRAHLDPEWAKAHLPWHYDHHMGKDQNQNWCVTFPLFDLIMGTRQRAVLPTPKNDRDHIVS